MLGNFPMGVPSDKSASLGNSKAIRGQRLHPSDAQVFCTKQGSDRCRNAVLYAEIYPTG